jgi:hypothetical protein
MPIKDMLKKDSDPFKNVALHGPEDISEWKRVPGLFRKWEFAQIVEDNDAISFQKHGMAEDGTQLWALYRHCPEATL